MSDGSQESLLVSKTQCKSNLRWWQALLFVPLAPLLLVFGVLVLVAWIVATICLHLAVWSWWCLRGRDILFVYSDSPIWRSYIEEKLLPFLGRRAVVLNWSQRKQWRFSLARLVFGHFWNHREFNPMAIVFRPFRLTRTFRFWQPFQDFKHGNPEALTKMENEFFKLIGVQRSHPRQCG